MSNNNNIKKSGKYVFEKINYFGYYLCNKIGKNNN